MVGETEKKDLYWNLMESKKKEMMLELDQVEKDADYDPKMFLELLFPNLNGQEIYKIWCSNKILNKFYDLDDTEFDEFK